jgi:hypothetical protein
MVRNNRGEPRGSERSADFGRAEFSGKWQQRQAAIQSGCRFSWGSIGACGRAPKRPLTRHEVPTPSCSSRTADHRDVYGIWLAQVLPPINVDGSDLQGRLIFAGVALLGLVVVTSELLSWYVGVTSLPARMQRLTSKSFARTDLDGSVGQLALTLGSVDRVRLAISVLVSGSALLLLLVTVAVAEILTLLAQANRGTIDPLLLASALFSIAWIAWIGYLCLIGAPRNREGRRRAYR